MTTAEGVNRLATADSFDGAMYLVQTIELIARAINSSHLGLDVRDGRRSRLGCDTAEWAR